MNELRIFNNADFGDVRTVEKDGNIWFVGKDVAEALGYARTADAVKAHIDADDKGGLCFTDTWRKARNYHHQRIRLILSRAFQQTSICKSFQALDNVRSHSFHTQNWQL